MQVLTKSNEKGDHRRLFIGPNGSLYRIYKYVGLFVDNVREGYGIAVYTNGDQLLGEFRNGKPNGVIVCKFAKSGRNRLALYDRGTRVRWLDGTSKDDDVLNSFNVDLANVKV